MTITQGAAVTAVRERLDEADSAGWTDVEIRRWINEAVTDIARKTETVQATATIDVDAGDQDHTLPATILRVNRVTFSEDNDGHIYPLEYMDYNAADSIWWSDQAITESRPRIFTTWGYPPALGLKLYPKPSVNGTLTVYYYAAPVALATDGSAANSTLAVAEGYLDLILDYAAYKALLRDGNPKWKDHKAIYDENLDNMMAMTRRWSDQAGTISLHGYPVANWVTGYGEW